MTKCWLAIIRVSEQQKPACDWTEANPKGQGEYKKQKATVQSECESDF